jgi:hypothetical protein
VYTKRGKPNPLFEIYFHETKLVYNNLDLEYVLLYMEDIPLKYHEISARYILEMSKLAAANSKPSAEELEDVEELENLNTEPLKKNKNKPHPKMQSKVTGILHVFF